MMTSQERVFKIDKVIFSYHTKDILNPVSSNLDHEVKSYSRSNSSTKMRKNKIVRKNFLGYKMGK